MPEIETNSERLNRMISKRPEDFQDLLVWQKSHELSQEIYKSSSKFAKKEMASLAEQLRSTVVEIPTNIAVGFKKRGTKVKVHYYRAALLAVEQLRYLLILANDLGVYKDVEAMHEECDAIEKMLKRLIRSNIQQN